MGSAGCDVTANTCTDGDQLPSSGIIHRQITIPTAAAWRRRAATPPPRRSLRNATDVGSRSRSMGSSGSVMGAASAQQKQWQERPPNRSFPLSSAVPPPLTDATVLTPPPQRLTSPSLQARPLSAASSPPPEQRQSSDAFGSRSSIVPLHPATQAEVAAAASCAMSVASCGEGSPASEALPRVLDGGCDDGKAWQGNALSVTPTNGATFGSSAILCSESDGGVTGLRRGDDCSTSSLPIPDNLSPTTDLALFRVFAALRTRQLKDYAAALLEAHCILFLSSREIEPFASASGAPPEGDGACCDGARQEGGTCERANA